MEYTRIAIISQSIIEKFNTEIIRSRPIKPPGEISIHRSGPISVSALLRRHSLQIAASQDPQCFNVFCTRGLNDIMGKLRSRRLLVPSDAFQIITDELLIEGRLGFARRILTGGPESR